MNLTYLAYKEDQIFLKVKDHYYQPQTALAKEKLHKIYAEYREVHLQYADLASGDNEALKRGLFIQWLSTVLEKLK